MNLENDTWEVITSYFRDIPNNLVRHHIDSYNDFVHNKIEMILKNTAKMPPIVLIDTTDNNITYEIKMHYGGREYNQFKLSKPTIKDYPSGHMRQLFPNEARLKDLTYGSDLFLTVEIDMTMKKNGVPVFENVPIDLDRAPFLKNIYIGKIPIMLRSDLCVLNELSGDTLAEIGEDPYEVGGYFIIDGAERTIVSQERKAENIIFLNTIKQDTGTEKFTHFAEVKCVSDEAFATARTVKIQLEKTGPITVRLGQKNPFIEENKGRDVPLFLMFRALGIESDKEIMQYIIGGALEGELAEKMMDLLRPSILDPYVIDEKIYSREQAEAYLVRLLARANRINSNKDGGFSEILRNKLTNLSFLYSTFNEALFPHITTTGNINKAKAYYLGYITRKLLLLRLGLEKDTDRDNFINKRIDLSGFLISTLFRDALQQFIRNVKVQTNSTYKFNFKEYSRDDIVYLINESNYNQIFNRDKFKEHFNSKLKIGNIGEKKGVVQSLDRSTRNQSIAHLRRIIDNIAGGRVTIPRRRLHATQYGCVCPVETPEGQKVGLNKGLAIISHITFGCPTNNIIRFIMEQGTESLDDLATLEVHGLCKVLVNGNWVGCHRNPAQLLEIFRLYRRNGLINTFIGISWDRGINEIKINTDQGRFVRPLYIVENNNILIQPRHINDIHDGVLTFTDLVSGFRKRKAEYDYYDNEVRGLDFIGLEKGDGVEAKLSETQAVVEYVDSQEFSTTLLPIGFNIPYNSLLKYTHAELHPSMMLSFNAHLLPFTNHNQANRTIFSSKQVKQGISTYAMNFNSRIDTNGVILNSPEKPLTICRINQAFRMDKFANGQNIYVAIAKYNYNQEDAIVGNQFAVDMGLFNISHFKMYGDKEMVDPKTGEMHKFFNPVYKDEIAEYPDELVPYSKANYDKIDKYGLPKHGKILEKDDVVIGKYMKGKDEHGNDSYKDGSTMINLDSEGTIGGVVDRVYTCQTNDEGDRMVKVRVCRQRPPVMGDKFVSRCAQKGTLGIIMRKEDLPYTEDGIVPDILLDPSSYPTRMTIAQLIELLFGNLAAELGIFGCYNAFETINVEQIADILENKLGLTSMGNRIIYNGLTGEPMEALAFSGVIYYERLKLLVDDKINTRLSGDRDEMGIPKPGGFYTVKERQSVPGRASGGGMKLGEMERDALLAHGIFAFIKESYIERCDKFVVQISKKSGEISICNPDTGLFYDNITDGMASYQLVRDGGTGKKGLVPDKIIGVNIFGQKNTDFIQVVIPYTFKVFLQEMQGMCLDVRMSVDIVRRLVQRFEETGDIVELDQDDIDEMMREMDDDEDAGYGEEYIDENDEELAGGGDEVLLPTVDTPIEEKQADEGEGEDADAENIETPPPESRPQLTEQSIQPTHQNQLQVPGIPGMMLPNTQQQHSGMTVTQDGGQSETMEVDLSQYGGVKPEFDVKMREDEHVIENMNAELLGLQKAGSTEAFEQAKAMGVQNALNTPPPPGQFSQQMPPEPAQPGLNMSFSGGGPQQPVYQQLHGQMMPAVSQPAMQQNGGSQPLSFNNNVKVIELDTKVSEGFFYSGSNNLDPFTNQKL